MIRSPSWAPTTRPLPQDAAQPHPHPAVYRPERRPVAVLEVVVPAPQHRVQQPDHRQQAPPVGPPRLRADLLTQLPFRLSAGPVLVALEVIAQDRKSTRL